MSELHWAAGFFDGEGSIYLEPRERGIVYLRVSTCNTEREVLERFVAVVGGSVLGPYSYREHPEWSGIFQWRANGSRARKVLELLYPHLTGPKRRQADTALAAERTAS